VFSASAKASGKDEEKMNRVYGPLILILVFLMTSCSKSVPTQVSGPGTATASGLQYWDVKAGTGTVATPGKTVSVHYSGWLVDGTKFDSSRDRNEPFQFSLGARHVIAGWDEGIAGMKVGGMRQLRIPPALGYGSRPNGPIPANSTLIFDVELLDVK
jgi:FKBP-type peptidyl-prolyl cis-trans isomerase FkpA